jgi:hypothetical protein
MMPVLLGVPGKLKTLLDRLTATRAGYLDKLNITGNVASSAEVAKASSWTSALATELDGLAPSIAAIPTTPINAITAISIAITAGNATGTQTITAVNLAKSIVILTGSIQTSGTAAIQNFAVHLVLTNTTTVTATRYVTTEACAVRGYVVEFK